jgi:hypothetical protein
MPRRLEYQRGCLHQGLSVKNDIKYVRLDQHVATEEGEDKLTKCFNILRVTSVMLLRAITGQSFSTGRGEISFPGLPFLFLEGGLLGDAAKAKAREHVRGCYSKSKIDIKLHSPFFDLDFTAAFRLRDPATALDSYSSSTSLPNSEDEGSA